MIVHKINLAVELADFFIPPSNSNNYVLIFIWMDDSFDVGSPCIDRVDLVEKVSSYLPEGVELSQGDLKPDKGRVPEEQVERDDRLHLTNSIPATSLTFFHIF